MNRRLNIIDKIKARIAFLTIDHNKPHDGSTAAWLKRLDEDSQVCSLRWVLQELENGFHTN